MLFSLYLYKYTHFFTANDISKVKFSLLSSDTLLERYSGETAVLCIIFLCGFTVFAYPVGILFSFFRGFMCGFSAMTVSGFFFSHQIAALPCSVILICSTLIGALEICVAAKAECFFKSLKTLCPDFKTLFTSKSTLTYFMTFLFVCFFIFIITGAVNLLN